MFFFCVEGFAQLTYVGYVYVGCSECAPYLYTYCAGYVARIRKLSSRRTYIEYSRKYRVCGLDAWVERSRLCVWPFRRKFLRTHSLALYGSGFVGLAVGGHKF